MSIRAMVSSNWNRPTPFDAVANASVWASGAMYSTPEGRLFFDASIDDVVEIDVPSEAGRTYRVSWDLFSTVFPFPLQVGAFMNDGGTLGVVVITGEATRTGSFDFVATDTSFRLQVGSPSDPANRGWQFEYLTVQQL